MKVDASKQRGITLIGFVIVLIVAGFFAYMGMVLGPCYSEYYSVVKSMNAVAAELKPSSSDMAEIRRSLNKQFNVQYVEHVNGKDAKLLRQSTGNSITLDWERREKFVYNIDFAVKFTHTVALGSKTAGD